MKQKTRGFEVERTRVFLFFFEGLAGKAWTDVMLLSAINNLAVNDGHLIACRKITSRHACIDKQITIFTDFDGTDPIIDKDHFGTVNGNHGQSFQGIHAFSYRLSGFIDELYAANPDSVGGAIPAEDFYYLPPAGALGS